MLNSTEKLIQALRSPACYSHPVSHVTVIETHISYIVLTGPYAYKIKKPVDLGFLDFSTLEKRRFYCEEELRLNRRLAPDIYLDVVAITGSAEHPEFEQNGSPIEYAVKMRQFPQEAMLDTLLEGGGVTPRHIDALADEIAQFHRSLPSSPPESLFGTAGVIRHPAIENFDQIRSLLPPQESTPLLGQLETWTEEELTRCAPLFALRKQQGFVRECHGDLHLGNIALIDGRITVFDCIEFNPNLRWIDVISEVAFTVMDLQDRQHPDYAARFLNRYLEQTGDYGALALLRYYLVYRAMVRAKVHCIRASQPDADASARRKTWEQFHRYVALAHGFTLPSAPALLITHGLSGSGKTTLTQPILESIGAIRMRSDVERKRLFGLESHEKSGATVAGGIYTTGASDRTFEHLAQQAAVMLDAGWTVIVDATFLDFDRRERFYRLSREHAVPFGIISFQADPATLRTRIASRQRSGNDASEAGLSVLEHQLENYQPLSDDEAGYAVIIDTEREDAAEITARVRTFLARNELAAPPV